MNPKMDMYCIETYTSRNHKVRTRANVYASLHGVNHSSERVQLSLSSQEKPVVFKKGRVDTFYLVIPEIIGLNGISLSCDGHSWEVDKVLVKVAGRTYKAVYNSNVTSETFQPLELIDDHTTPFMDGKILLGPMLKLRGNFENIWSISAMIVTENVASVPNPLSFYTTSPDSLSLSAPPVCFYQQNNNQMWRFDFQIPVNHAEQLCTYRLPTLEHKEFTFHIPAQNQKPGILFCSCNDRAHPYNMTPNDSVHKSVGWDYMHLQSMKDKYHLLLLGGDQIYADSLFYACPTVRAWDKLPKSEKYPNSAFYFNTKAIEELNCYYFNMYIFCWMYRAMAGVTSSVPTAMMYDDHDIYDGWGSLDPEINDSDMMINIFKVARKHFFLFQMQGELSSVVNEPIVGDDPDIVRKVKDTPPFEPFGYPQILNDQGPFNTCIDLTGGVSVVLLDLRSERRMFTHNAGIIMRENSYRNFEKFLMTRAQRPESQHLFCVLTVPIHYPDANVLNKAMDITHHELIDDVRDHYSAVIHKEEQARVLNDLADFCVRAAAGSKASILSGDVHLGCYSTADVMLHGSRSVRIEQYVSSGIAAQPPPRFAQVMMRTPIFRNKDKITSDLSQIVQAMERLPSGKYFLSTQNFLCLDPNPATYRATWVGNPKLKKVNKMNNQLEFPLALPASFGKDISAS